MTSNMSKEEQAEPVVRAEHTKSSAMNIVQNPLQVRGEVGWDVKKGADIIFLSADHQGQGRLRRRGVLQDPQTR